MALYDASPIPEKLVHYSHDGFVSSESAAGLFAAGLVPFYRAYNNGFTRGVDSNHRITANHGAYLAQVAKGWTGEGVVMCAPAK